MPMNYSRFCNQMLIIFFFGVSFSSPQPENDFYSESWALLIGINKYQNETPLNYAVADALEMQRLLTEKLGFPEKNITLLLNDAATLQGIKKSMQELASRTSENDRVVIYFAGHGQTQSLPSGGEEGYLIPVNGKSSDLFSTSLAMSEMNRLSNMTPAKDMLFLMDACYSGLMGVGNRGLNIDETTPNYLKKIAAGGSRTVITAGKKGEVAQERAEWGHSPFVKNLISGLEKGMADFNGDGYITDSELGQYLIYQVTADTENKQTPSVSHLTTNQGQFVFIIGEVDLQNVESADEKLDQLDYDKLAEKIAEKYAEKVATQENESPMEEVEEESVNELLEKLSSLGIKINPEEIEKLGSEKINELGNKVGLANDDEEELIENSAFSKSPTWHFENNEASPVWVRYNRSEGFYLQLNKTFQSEIIPGSSFYGGIGRSFHRNEYQWIFGFEQLIWSKIIQIYFEGFDKSLTPDAWRVWDGENSMAAFFLKKDYLDWYKGKGFRAAGFLHIKNYFSIGTEYNQISQSLMNNILEGDNFIRETYKILEGNNNYLKTIFSLGYPINIGVRKKLQFYSSFVRSQSIANNENPYSYDQFFLNLLAPYNRDMNFIIKILAGASDVDYSIWNSKEYHQHIFEIGGKGTLRGYGWKEFATSHYFLSTIEIWFDEFGVFYDRAVIFESYGNTINPVYFSDLFDNLSDNVQQSAGISFGDEDASISFIRKLNGEKDTIINLTLTFGAPLQYW